MASAPAENTPQLSHVNVFWKKNIFPLDVVRFLGGTEEGQPGGPRGKVLEFTGPWVSLNQTPLLLVRSLVFILVTVRANFVECGHCLSRV